MEGGTKMKFNTQVCTTREQSERLLALGLNKETADCFIWQCDGKDYTSLYSSESAMDERKGDIPAWSLHRLVSMCADNNFLSSNQVSLYNFSTYDRAIDLAEYLISHNHFNKQYLNQKL